MLCRPQSTFGLPLSAMAQSLVAARFGRGTATVVKGCRVTRTRIALPMTDALTGTGMAALAGNALAGEGGMDFATGQFRLIKKDCL